MNGISLLLLPIVLVASTTDYMPLQVGNRWTYRQTVGTTMETLVNRILEARKKGGKDVFVLEVQGERGDKTTSLLYWTAEGLIQEDSTAAKFSPPMTELALPAKPGTAWKWSGTVTIGGATYKATAQCKHSAVGKLTVPAGTFEVLVIVKEVLIETGGQPVTVKTTDSYARGVGWVKGVLESGGRKTVTELVSYELKR